MRTVGLCHICGKPAMSSCPLCGRLVCGSHFERTFGMCSSCKGSDGKNIGKMF